MAKADLFKNPVLAWLLRSLGAYPVERGGADAGVLKKSIRMLNDGCCVGMFPQGTRRAGVDPSTTTVRGGVGLIAANAKATVLPVFIKSKGNRTRFLRPVHVIVGEPIKYEEYTAGGEKANDYTYISNYVFQRICDLGKDEDK
jgi:1-acyl-sn-glycerol-3-phosphate acyltransferase